MPHRHGLYLPDGSFMNFADDPAQTSDSLFREIATRSRSLDYYAIGNMYLPNPDPVLKAQGKDIRVYTDLMIDDRVGGSMINRINATLALDWEIDRGKSRKSRKARFIQEVFGKLSISTIIEQTVRNPRAYGYGPIETIWVKRGDGLNAPVDVLAKPQRWFVFDQSNNLRFLSRDHLLTGEELPARRFLCPTNEASYDNPYGLGLNSRCFWPVVFKKGGWRFRIKFSEKYGAVWPVGKLPRSATSDQIDDLLDILERMINDGIAVIPDDGSVDFLESGSKGSTSDMYHAIISDADSAISTVWLGHAGAGQSVSGELGGKEVAADVRKDLRDSDKTLVEQTMNTLIDYICEENWGTSDDAPRFCLWEEEDVDEAQAKRDASLSESMEKSGLKFTRAYYLRTYNLEEDDVEEKQPDLAPLPPAPPSPQGERGAGSEGAFSETNSDPADAIDILVDQALDDWQPVMKPVVDPVRRAVAEAADLPDLLTRINGLMTKMDSAELVKSLAANCLIARAMGDATDEV